MAVKRHIHMADLFEILADAIPDRPALFTNEVEYTFAQLDERVTRLANHLRTMGIKRGDWVAIHSMNRHEWVESFYACVKLGAAPVNINFRYVEAELRYVYENADCVAAIVSADYLDIVRKIQKDLPKLKSILVMGDEYEAAVKTASPERDFGEREPDDPYVIYTGGTTGMPKGVVWRNEDAVLGAMNASRLFKPLTHPEIVAEEALAAPMQLRLMALGPMMHGGGQWVMGNAYVSGQAFVLYTLPRFDANEVWKLASKAKANSVSTIGDAMGRPLAEDLLNPNSPKYDLSSLFSIGNGGAPLTLAVKNQLREAMPNIIIMDSFGASETGSAAARMDQGEQSRDLKFEVREDCTVLDEDGNVCPPGVVGKLARMGPIPLRYHKDDKKTAETFPTYNGVRYVIPGDFAMIEGNVITLLGRGSQCINSGGEKIFPEEVEAALKQHAAIFDAAVAGTPSERWGQQVTAMVQVRPGMSVTEEDVRAHCREHIADYKVPKQVFIVGEIKRTPVGKVDYKWAVAEAASLVGA
ncbi:MAG: acyl-CoA synthetase [Actinomycetota bacterium]